MFSLGSFTSRRPPDAWRLTLTFHHESLGQQEREVAWVAGEPEAGVLAALADTLAAPGLVHEAVHVTLHTASGPLLGVVAAAGFGAPVRLALQVAETRSRLVGVELVRTSGTAALPTSLALALWQDLEAAAVTRLRVADAGAVAALADARVAARFTALRVLNLSNAGLTALPASVGLLTGLEELRVVGNQLRILPPEIGQLTNLRVLAADSNQLTILPGELRRCEQLEELTLQHNRLTSVLLSFASLRHLSVLHLYDNPLDFLPEISPCSELTHLTVANLRITADQAYTKFKVEFLPPPPGGGGGYSGISLWDSKQSDRLRPIFALMLRRSSGHHPLLAGALRQLAEEDSKNRELMARQENGLQQLVLMALGDNPVVVEETCRTLALLARHSPALADAVVANDADALLRLLPAADERRALATLGLLAALAHSSSDASARLATDALLACLTRMVGGEGGGGSAAPSAAPGEAVRTAALKALGNLAFCDENRRRLERRPALMQRLSQLALSGEEPTRVQVAALRVLAILGENELVERAAGRPPIQGRGVRILSLDGGGMKGMATVRLLRELERHTGKRIWELFDLIVGTSTGGLLAVALGLLKLDMDACDHIYKVLGRKVFSRVVAAKDAKEESWMESFYRTFQTKTSHVRAVVVGYKHDAAVYESLLREYCDFSKEERCIGDTMIDTAVLGPKVALVSTLSSLSPAPPFLFRTYQLPPGSETLAAQIGAHAGSCKHPVWQAVRASSAASFYLEDFSCGGDKFQDGAVTANNPAVIALQEARLLWPDHPIDVLMSVGVGVSPAARREKGLSSFMETGSILIESATSVSRADEALSTLMPLIPGVKYLRFCANDPRCNMELDEVDPERWAQLEAATEEYIAAPTTQAQYAEAAAVLLQVEAALAVDPPQASLKLGARRKLLVLRAPRLGAQQLSMDDAVAASLAYRPGCVAAVDLQRLGKAQHKAGAGSTSQLAGQLAAMPSSNDVQQPRSEALAPAPRTASDEPSGTTSSQARSSEDEGGSLSAYISSWFSSPTKQAKLASPPAAAAGSSGQQQQQQQPLPPQQLQQQQDSIALQADVPGRVVSSARTARSPVVSAARRHAGNSAALASTAERLTAKLEEQLAALLPSVGVVHLGLELAGAAGLVLRWQQQLQAVAEPSAQAASLLLEAGRDPSHTRLADLFAAHPSLHLPGGRSIGVLSSQSRWENGSALSLLLLSVGGPEVLLPASSLTALRQLLRKQLVVCTAALPPDYVDALLSLGANGVVTQAAAADAALLSSGLDDFCTFFSTFYDALLAGSAVSDSLQAAEAVVPVLKDFYCLHCR